MAISQEELIYECKMTTDEPYIPFSQRAGIVPIPPQLKLGEVSGELRGRLAYCFQLEYERNVGGGYSGTYFLGEFRRVAQDFHVLFLGQDIRRFNMGPARFCETVHEVFNDGDIGRVFDLVEFFTRHRLCSSAMKSDFVAALADTRAAYRIIDGKVIAIGTDEQGAAVAKAIDDADRMNEKAARKHLIDAGTALRDANWAASVRESIHAVEATALRLAPDAKTLGPALATLERNGHLHGSLKAAFNQLYGYSSDEEGVRHALVFNEEVQVDEADALFMLGACASFVSYLLNRMS